MAYGVEEGSLSVSHTLIEEGSALENLTLSARQIQIDHSVLSPSETVSLTAGRFIKGLWDPLGALICSDDDKPSPTPQHSIVIDESTILSSKAVSLRSLEEGASIYAMGLLQSTQEDIIIQAIGDVYINKLFAARNLLIHTTGNVYIGDDSFVGGFVDIKGKGIRIDKGLSSIGRLFIESSEHLSLQGRLSSQDAVTLSGTKGIDFKGDISSQGAFTAKSDGKIVQKGSVSSEESITFAAPEGQNYGRLETKGILTTPSHFYNQKGGSLKARSLSEPLAVLSRNQGRIVLEDSLSFTSQNEKLEGNIKIHGSLNVAGDALTVKGQVSVLGGTHFDLKTFTNTGTFSSFGAGLQGRIEELVNEGKLDLSLLNAKVAKTNNRKTGIIRTRGHFALQGNHYRNDGTVFTCGVHQLTLDGTYADAGTFYSPTLFLLKASKADYFPNHTSYLKDGIINTTFKLGVGEKARFQLDSNGNKSFLQLKSGGDITFDGEARQFSISRFPLLEYFKIFNEPASLSYEDFRKEISFLPLGPWEKTKRSLGPLGAGVVLQADRNISSKGVIHPESGSVSLIAGGQLQTDRAHIKAGYFKGNNIAAQGKVAYLKDSTITSLFGDISLFAQQSATLIGSHLLGRQSTTVFSPVVDIEASTLKSQEKSVAVLASSSAEVKKSTLQGQSVHVHGGERLHLSLNNLVSEYNKLTADHIDASSNTLKGPTSFEAQKTLQIHDLRADGTVLNMAPEINLAGQITAASLASEGDHIKTTGDLSLEENLHLKAKKVEQFGTTSAGKKSHIEATDQYVDTADSRNEAGETLTLIAEETEGFKGQQKAGSLAVIKLQDMNLLALLNQVDAPSIEASLKDGEISFDEDVVIQQNLKLWAKKLENKKALTTQGDFIAHLQKTIMNEGSMMIRGKGFLGAREGIITKDIRAGKALGLKTEGTLGIFGMVEGSDVQAKGKQVTVERLVRRQTISGGYQDVLESEAGMRAHVGDVTVEAEELLSSRGGKFKAKINVNLKSGGTLYLGAQQTSSDFRSSDKHSSYHLHTLSNHKTEVTAGNNVNKEAGKAIIFEGLDTVAGGDIHAKSEGTFDVRTVHDSVQEESQRSSRRGILRNKRTETREKASSTVVRNTSKAGEKIPGGKIHYESKDDMHLQAPDMKSEGPTIIQSHQGKPYVEGDKSSHMSSTQKTGKSLVWQSQQAKGSVHEKGEMAHIIAKGGLIVSGANGVVVGIKAGDLESDPRTAWVKGLRNDPAVIWQLISEEHKTWNHKAQGLTGPATAVIALAIGIASGGTGSALMGLSSTSLGGAMASAAFTSLVSQASISLINNQGDLSKTFKDLGSKENLRSFATSIASAGVLHGVSEQLGLPVQAKGFTQHLQVNLARSAVSSGMSMALLHEDPKEALNQALRGIVAGTLGGVMANAIGKAYHPEEGSAPKIDPVMHKFLHALSGAGMGAILSKDPAKGAVAGAMGAALAETIADFLSSNVEDMAKDLRSKAKAEGRSLTVAEAGRELETALHRNADMARLSTATMALLTGQDVHTAISTSHNALDNNFIMAALPWLIGAGMTAWAAHDVYDAYEEGGEKAALMQLGIEIGTTAVGGVAFKIAGKVCPSITTVKAAVEFVLEKNPTLKLMLGNLVGELTKYGEKITNSTVAQKVAKFDAKLDQAFERVGQKFARSIDDHIIWGKGQRAMGPEFSSTLNALDLLETKTSSTFWKHTKTLTYFGQTNKVYQRTDLIHSTLIDAKGRTNLERMQRGLAPIGPDNRPINLHHMLQTQDGSLAEMTQYFHKKNHREIHINPSSIPSGIDRTLFDRWRTEYWKTRAKDFEKIREK